jgi:DNA-binding GntR family transcriptional regulator
MKHVLTLKENAYENILKRLKRGKFAPGVRLSDDALAKELGVSRSPVREALLQLSGEGLVEQRPRQGAFVRVPDQKELAELFEARLALEGAAAGWAAQRRSDHDLEKLFQLTERMEAVASSCREAEESICDSALTNEFLSVDYQAHILIVKMADNRKIAQMIRICRVLSRSFSLASLEHEAKVIVHSVEQHRAFTDAIGDQDAQQATEAMARHITYSGERVMDAYDRAGPDGLMVAE